MKKAIISTLIILLCGFVFFNVGALFSQEEAEEDALTWFTSFDEAVEKADRENKYIFVLITAPSWCKPCQFLESEIFTDSRVQAVLKSNYIPVKILDTNEEELENFDVLGFPTLYVYDDNGEFITPIKGRFVEGEYTPSDLVNALRKILINVTEGLDDDSGQSGCGGGVCPGD
jgi:uncharacterized protein YyaL (SSP411 family)